jgi:2-dehydro-3-deoxyphosphogluconate aldolase/(4S)-4-hydroxy-2-oxoglutarate aldolase
MIVSSTHIVERIHAAGVIPVVTLVEARNAPPLAAALARGGLPCAEVTFRTTAAVEAIQLMSQRPDFLVGAGTVLNPAQVDQAVGAGAQFIVTPGFSAEVVRACVRSNVPVIPGVATATELQMALEEGVTTVKFFPAEPAGGTRALSALAAPFGMMRFVPTGGISLSNLSEYLRLACVTAVGGSWITPPEALRDRRFDVVTDLAEDAVRSVDAARAPAVSEPIA